MKTEGTVAAGGHTRDEKPHPPIRSSPLVRPAVRPGRLDPVCWLVVALSAVVYSLHGFEAAMDRDVGIYAYGGQQFIDGVPPYESIFNVTGPLAHMLAGIGVLSARIFGIDDVLAMRIVYLVFSCLTVAAIYALTRELFRSRLIGLVGASAFLSFLTFVHYATSGPRAKTPMVLFGVLCLLLTTRRRWVLAGVTGGLATLVWQPAVLFPLAAVAMALGSDDGRRRWHALAAVIAGGAMPLAASLVYFGVTGSFGAFIDGYVIANVRHVGPSAGGLLTRVGRVARVIADGYRESAIVVGVGLATLPLVLAWRLVRAADGLTTVWRDRFTPVFVAGLLALAWSLFDFQGPPDAFLLLPFAACGAAGLVHGVARLTPQRVSVVLAVGTILGGVVLATWLSATTRSHALTTQRGSVEQLLAAMPPGAELMSFGAPEAMVLAQRTNPHPYLILIRGLDGYLDATWPGGLSAFVGQLREDPPEVVARGNRAFGTRSEPIQRWLREEYVEVGRVPGVPGWRWLVHERAAGELRAVTVAE